LRRDKLRPVAASLGSRALDDPLQTEQKYPVLLEYPKAPIAQGSRGGYSF